MLLIEKCALSVLWYIDSSASIKEAQHLTGAVLFSLFNYENEDVAEKEAKKAFKELLKAGLIEKIPRSKFIRSGYRITDSGIRILQEIQTEKCEHAVNPYMASIFAAESIIEFAKMLQE